MDLEINRRFYSIWAIANSLYTRFANKLGVSYPELMVLYALFTMKEITQKEISDSFGLSKQTVNSVIRGLKEKNYVMSKVCENDKRERALTLNEQGNEYASKIISPVLKAETQVYNIIGKERLIQANETMKLFNILFEKLIDDGEI